MSLDFEIEVVEDKEAVAQRATVILVAARGHIALSGGSTPKRTYALAGEQRSDWSDTTLWLGDERLVPADDGDSNFGMARGELGDGAPLEPVDTSLELQAAAADYGRRLKAALGPGGRLDLALMGLGPDGHTASLFPGKPALEEDHHLVAEVPEPGLDPRVPRVTMTFPVFNAARDVVFLVAGEDKADAMVRAFGDSPDPDVPSAHVRPHDGRLLVIADRAAAAHLR